MSLYSIIFSRSLKRNISSQVVDKQRESTAKLISEIRNMQFSNPQILNDVFVPCRNYVLGYKALGELDPSLFCSEKVGENIVEMIKNENSSFEDSDFQSWIVKFVGKIQLQDIKKFNYQSNFKIKEVMWFISLSDLDIYYLCRTFQDHVFDQLIFKILPLNRLRKVFFDGPLTRFSETIKDLCEEQLLSHELRFFYDCSIEHKKKIIRYKLSKRELQLINDYLDNCSRDTLVEVLAKKSVLELSYVMLELDSAYKIKLYNLLVENVRKRVADFTSNEKPLFHDGQIAYNFVREIKNSRYT